MNEYSTSATIFTENQVGLAEEHYQRGNLTGAIQIVKALTFDHPNTSANHRKTSLFLVAYQIHRRSRQDDATHYDILNIKKPFCRQQVIEKKYKRLVAKLCPDRNKSVAAKSAFRIINTALKVLSDPVSRRDYNKEEGFERRRRIMFREDEPRQGKRHCAGIINDSDSDSDH